MHRTLYGRAFTDVLGVFLLTERKMLYNLEGIESLSLEPVINFADREFAKKCLYIVYTFRHYARDETDAKELSA
jgi:hypothetical protein